MLHLELCVLISVWPLSVCFLVNVHTEFVKEVVLNGISIFVVV